MPYEKGDYIKVEAVNQETGESERLWVEVDHCDEGKRIVFGRLDNMPVLNTDMKLGQELAVSYDNIREHRKSASFNS